MEQEYDQIPPGFGQLVRGPRFNFPQSEHVKFFPDMQLNLNIVRFFLGAIGVKLSVNV